MKQLCKTSHNLFKWLKQHLKIKRFWGATKNAVRIQISVAIINYCLVAIVHHDMQLKRSTYEVLQILSISLTVVGYYGGSLDSLLRTDALVSKVVRNLDGEVVANNFEWKANTAPFR